MKKLVIGIVCLLLVGTVAAWYIMRDGDKARDILPADATAVAVIEPAGLFKALGLSLDKVSNKVEDLRDLIEAFDLEEPVYAFASESGLTGFALNVNNADKLKKAAANFNFNSDEDDGYMWITGSHLMGCSDGDKLLLCGPDLPTKQEMVRLMKQGRQDVPLLDKANRQKGYLRVSTSLSNLPREFMPKGFKSSDAFLSAALSIGKQDVTLSAKVEDEDGKPFLFNPEGEELLQSINGLLPTVVPDHPFAWLCLGVKGEQLLKILRCGPRVSAALMALNVSFFDADLMLKAIDGDVVIMMPKANLSHPEVLITAEISNSDFLKEAKDWDTNSTLGGMSLRKRGEADDYVFTFQGEKLYFGVRGGLLYMASSEHLASQVLQESAVSNLQPMVAGKYLSGSVDVGQLLKAYPSVALLLTAIPSLGEAVKAVDKLEVTSNKPQSIELSLKTNEPVKVIMSNFWKLMKGK